MSTLREAAQQALEACTDAVVGWQSLAPLSVRRAAMDSLDALRAALEQQEPRRTGLPHCEHSCEAQAFLIEIRRLKAELAAEREACADICDGIIYHDGKEADRCAAAIRARSKE